MNTIDDLKIRAQQIRNAMQEGENTAERVGSLFEDIVDYAENIMEEQDAKLSDYYNKTQIDAKESTQNDAIARKANSSDLADVATSGNYSDLKNTPVIPVVPTNVSAFTNDARYLTEHQNLDGKQDVLVNQQNIKSINGQSILGGGDLIIETGGTITIDQSLSDTSENPVQNKTITATLEKAGIVGKLYDPEHNSGLGRKILALKEGGSNVLTQSDFNQDNTIYTITYDFDLDGGAVSIPNGCVLEFDGGTVSNGTIVGNNTCIDADKIQIFGNNLILEGTFNVKESYPEWFGAFPNDSTIDATPAIKKLVAAGMPVQFSDGIYYLSECLLHGLYITLKGTGTHYKEGTIFKAFYPNSSQRFILKLGGRDDFDNPGAHSQEYESIQCRYFILEGIDFDTYNTKLINANISIDDAQNYAACCFDWCAEGYVDIRTEGECPGVFIANTWEVYFECLCLYGSQTEFNESALYFGRAYTNYRASNLSAITINNLFAETIWGKVVGTYNGAGTNGANIADIIINNIEFEPYSGNSDLVSHTRADAAPIIENNIHKVDGNGEYTMGVQYFFEFGKERVIIHSLTSCAYSVTYRSGGVDDAIARGLIKGLGTFCDILIEKITIVNDCDVIIGAENNATVRVGEIVGPRWSGNCFVYTRTNPNTDTPNFRTSGVVLIGNTTAIIDKDQIKEYGNGLLFDAKTVGEVSSLIGANNKCVLFDGLIDNILTPMVYFSNHRLGRKFKFKKNSKLVFNYNAPNKWLTTGDNIVITYYKNGATLSSDSIALEENDTKLMSNEYEVYDGEYDYCTIGINSFVSIKSVEVRIPDPVPDSAVMYPGLITNEVKSITSQYSADDVYKLTALQYFFNKIASFKHKINHMILPIFSSNDNEAIYDIITGSSYLPVSGTNHLTFNNTSNRAHLDVNITDNWEDGSYRCYEGSTFDGTFAIMSVTDDIGRKSFLGCTIELNDSPIGWFKPKTTDNKKIIGCGITIVNGSKTAIRVGDNSGSDRVTYEIDTSSVSLDYVSRFFGSDVPSIGTNGVRILVTSDQTLTIDEAKTLRDAVITLDNKYFV